MQEAQQTFVQLKYTIEFSAFSFLQKCKRIQSDKSHLCFINLFIKVEDVETLETRF